MAILALADPTFQPAMREITAITNADPAQVSTSFAHDYLSGLVVRLYIPEGFGMEQANELTGTITVTGASTFLIDINTIGMDAFAVPAGNLQLALVVPVGEINSQLNQATKNVL